MKKILTVIGARPQFVKASVVSHAMAATGVLQEVVLHTGQHFDSNMSDVFFKELSVPSPKHNLGVHGGTHGAMTGHMLEGIEKVLLQEKPDVVLVYGDTNSTLAGALAAAKLHIPVAHVEAGLRSNNMRMPEEINRVLTDRVSTWLFAPTDAAVKNLQKENIAANTIFMVGDVMYDVALRFGNQVRSDGQQLGLLGLTPKSYVLVTIHRAENTDSEARLLAIVDALEALAGEIPIVLPLHPRTRAVLQRLNRLEVLAARVHLIEPVGYMDMVQLEKYAALIATDSGGVQKEAYFYGVPCLTLRDETEWAELVESGWNRLASPVHPGKLLDAMKVALGSIGKTISLYGDGDAAGRIAKVLSSSVD